MDSGCNVLGAPPQTPFSLFFADEVGKKERKEDSRGHPTGTRAPQPRLGRRCNRHELP